MNSIHRNPARSVGEVLIAHTFDWARLGVWVSRVETVQVVCASTEDRAAFHSANGEIGTLSTADFRKRYVQIGPAEWHSRFLPVLAVPVARDCYVDIGGGEVIPAEAGGAVLNDGGCLSIIGQSDYSDIYRVVGHPGLTKPVAPFVY